MGDDDVSTTSVQQDVTLVPGAEHYSLKYLRGGRLFSYAHQIKGALSFEPQKVAEIGAGGKMVAAAIRSIGIDVTTIDVQPDLKPDVVASVTELPFEDGHFDVVLCCQVLEHLPFEQFDSAMRELRRVARKGAILSLPDVTQSFIMNIRLPKIPNLSIDWTLPRLRAKDMPKKRFEKSGHYWEIGFRPYPITRVRKAITDAGWTIDEEWRVPERRWHHFFRLVV